MTLVHSLNELLENTEEPLTKRLKLADNAFKSSQLLLPHKEFVLLKWILTNSDVHSEETWDTYYKWIKSDQFRELNRNDISNEEISNIIELLTKKLALIENVENELLQKIINSFLILTESAIFQQYFNYHIETYCQLVCSVLQKISCTVELEEFLKRNLFSKTIISEEKFHKCFLDIVLPAFTEVLLRFNSQNIFEEVSRVVRKCIFYRNYENFSLYIKQHFEDVKIGKQTVPKILFKRLLHFYEDEAQFAKIKYKLIFNAFYQEFENDFELVYKFFILLLHIIGFKLDELILNKTAKLEISKTKLFLEKSQEIVLDLFDVLSDKNNASTCKVNELTFTEFITNILKQILYFNTPSSTSYKIFSKALVIDPVAIESITHNIIVYAMMADNKQYTGEYENLIISIFDLYSKLHRTENLVAKIVSILYDSFGEKNTNLNNVYEFRGQNDVKKSTMDANNFNIDDIFTGNILNHFTSCISSLASWQVINVFKTLLFYLNKSLNNINNVGNDDCMYFTYMEVLSSLLGTFLSSVRIAEHTVTDNVVDKSIKELDNLKNSLKIFGVALLNREHNHRLMQSFLNIAYYWAEMYIILTYYSTNHEVELKKSLDNDFTSCNITYLHHYLTIKQWCLISERITNFGELPCKHLWKKMYIQKLKAMLLFEESINDDVIINIIKSISSNLENNWRYILGEKFIVNNLLAKMNSTVLLSIAESLLSNLESFENLHKQFHIFDSSLLLTSMNYVGITKINKLIMKHKRKLNENTPRISVSSKICSLLSDDVLSEANNTELVEKIKEIYHVGSDGYQFERKIKEDKVNSVFSILKKFPVIYGSEVIQKVSLLYLCSLHDDFETDFQMGKYEGLQKHCEDLIIGILQHNKSKMLEVLDVDIICSRIVRGYQEWEQIFTLITENVFRNEDSIMKFDAVVEEFVKNIENPNYMRCCFLIINSANKVKKTKMSKDIKSLAEKYKAMICDKILELISENKPDSNLIIGFAYSLKNFLQDDEKFAKLLKYLNSYVEFAATDLDNCENYLTLFSTVLQNQSKIQSLGDNFVDKIWNICKEIKIGSKFDEYSQLLVLIFGHIPNESFSTVTSDLLNITDNSFTVKDYELLGKYLKTWESVVSCNLNPVKTKILMGAIEKLLQKLILLLQDPFYDEILYQNIVGFEKCLIQTSHFLLTPPIMDMLLLSTTIIMAKKNHNFREIFHQVIILLEQMLRYRKPLIMDRLPPYLRQYRMALKSLCQKSNADLNLEEASIREVSDCAHQFEKLTKNMVSCQKDMARIAMYMIADILEQYEQISLNPTVKIHLNNCIYSFISICDQHAISFLMRVLSSASTEIFKIMLANYKRYYRFTGKV